MKSGLKLALVTLPIMLIGVAFVVFVVVNRSAPERNPLAERAVAVRVVVAQSHQVAPLATGFGIVRPARTYEAIAQVGGTAEYVNPALQKGAILPAGTVLLRLSPADFDLAIAQVEANIRAAEAKLAELAVSEQNLSSALAIENEALSLKTSDLDRTETLFSGGTVSQSTRDAARAVHLAQRQKVLSVESTLALLPTQRAVQGEQIAVYRVNLDTARLNLARTELTLPFAARVASLSVEVGQFVRAGQAVAQLDGIEAAEVEAQVPVAKMLALLRPAQHDAQALALDPSSMTEVMRGLGLTAIVRLRLGQDVLEWPAAVDRISDSIDQKTGTLGIIVRVDTPYSSAEPGDRPPLTKGMFVEVAIAAPAVEGTVIPRSALRNGQLMIADASDRLQLVSVTTRLVQGEIALISEGLEPGARVIVSAPSPVVAGMLLGVTEDTALMAHLAAAGEVE